jgi:hypothetical protein
VDIGTGAVIVVGLVGPGDLQLNLASAAEDAVLVPKRLAREQFVLGALAICGEGTVCD